MENFDHAVIYCGEQLAQAAQQFQQLGFTVTPRGEHSLGSANYLIVFGSTYIELLGFAPGQSARRPELAGQPTGLDALVFASQDAQATHARLRAHDVPVTAVSQFSRPVDLGDGAPPASWPLAQFRTVRTAPGFCAAGRLYFCEHLTPELVWRDPWRAHPNGAFELAGASLTLREPRGESDRWARLLGDDALEAASSQPASWAGVEQVSGPAGRHDGAAIKGGFAINAPPLSIDIRAGEADRMTRLTLRVPDPTATAAWLAARGVACRHVNVDSRTGVPAMLVTQAAQASGVVLQWVA